MRIADRDIPAIEDAAYKELERNPGTPGLIRFNEVIDETIREKPEYADSLMKLAFNRLPYLREEPTVVFVTGGVADPWAPAIEKFAQREGVSVKVVKLPGSLSFARGGNQKAVPEFPADLKKYLAHHPAIFLDDTYTNGGTAAAVREAVEKSGGKLDGVFVAYEGGKGDPSSLYKTGRNNRRPPSMINFPRAPDSWRWAKGQSPKIAVELEGTLLVDGTKSLNPQGEKLLREMAKLGTAVQFWQKGKPVAAPELVKKFGLKTLRPEEKADLAIGNWGRGFMGSRKGSAPGIPHVETLRIGAYRDEGVISHDLLDQNYFLNRLSELGALKPQYQGRVAKSPEPGFSAGLDLRAVAAPQAPRGSHDLAAVVKIEDSKARVAKLSKISWNELADDEQGLMLQLAPQLNNSFEIGQYIRIAGASGDARWAPVLETWLSQWKNVERGWQTFVRGDAEKALQAIRAGKPAAALPANKAVQEIMKQGKSSEHPVLYLLAGAPGAGKNTVMEKMAKAGYFRAEDFVNIDADELRKSLAGYSELAAQRPGDVDRFLHQESTALRDEVFTAALKQKKNIIRQGTLTPPEEAEALVAKLAAEHPEYEIRVVHVGVDSPAVSVERIKNKVDEVIYVDNTGAEPKITSTYERPWPELKLPETTPLNPAKNEIHYEVHGAEHPETLVLIHGLDSSTRTFDPVVPELAKKYKVVVYDQRGHGLSAAKGDNYSSETMAKDLGALLDHLGIKQASILGHSMGGRTAMKFAELHPDRVKNLLIEDMEPIQRASRNPKVQARRAAKVKEVDAAFADPHYASRDALTAALTPYYGREAKSLTYRRAKENPDGSMTLLFRPGVSNRYGYQANTEALEGKLGAFPKPLLFLRSDPAKGTAISEEGVEAIEKLANAQMLFFSGTGHNIHGEKAKEYVAAVESFLGTGKIDPKFAESLKFRPFTKEEIQLDKIRAIVSPVDRVGEWKKVTGSLLSPAQNQELQGLAAGLDNSFEIGEFIRLASESGDAGWAPALDAWAKKWEGTTIPWQHQLRERALRARKSLK